jgi:hypothetical protein
LVWLFYDNTTIIRKTLENFEKELVKETELNEVFNKIDKNKERIGEYINQIIPKYKQLIDQYYYSSFNKYVSPTRNYPNGNPDGIDFVQKLLYVLYAKIKLEKLNHKETKNTDLFHDNIKSLLDLFVKIMGANAAIFCIKGKITENINDIHWISTFDKEIENFDERYYTYEILNNNSTYIYPIILNYELFEKFGIYTANNELYGGNGVSKKYEHLNCIWINTPRQYSVSNKPKPVAVISFLYEEHFENKSDFLIISQEYGRLLLLLKNELNIYIESVLQNKISNLWVEKNRSEKKFDKIYANNNHAFTFMDVFAEMEKFEGIEKTDKELLRGLSSPWFVFTNLIISYLYATIERKEPYGVDFVPHTLETRHTLGDIFNETFDILIYSLLDQRWNEGEKEHQIIITKPIDNGSWNYDTEIKVGINKHFIRTIIIQQLDNSLNEEKGHCAKGVTKRVNITITNSSIRIEEKQIVGEIPEIKKMEISEFIAKRENIKNLDCRKYSSTTLTSLQGVINFMNKTQTAILYGCDYDYIENNFFVEITYKEKQNEQN